MSKEANSTERALKLALEALENWVEYFPQNVDDIDKKAITSLREALAQDVPEVGFGNMALDKKAENARELGLDYEPAQPYKSIAAHINQATNSGVRIDPVTGDVGIGTPSTPAQQEPVACSVCDQVHSILDGDASKIIRNAQDGYPDGRSSRILTLQERVMALCRYASDWKRWCLEKESTSPPAQRTWVGLTDEEYSSLHDGLYQQGKSLGWVVDQIEDKLREKNT